MNVSIFEKAFKRQGSSYLLFIDPSEITLTKSIGKGAFGLVQKGNFKGTSVAVKSLLVDSTQNEKKIIHDFVSEVKKLSQLDHPNIVGFIGVVKGACKMVMEYLEIGPLNKYIEHHQNLSWLERYDCAMDISQGMAYLHSKVTSDGKKKPDLFHQDLKSANVLLTRQPGRLTAKICDFGLSVLRERQNATSSILTQEAAASKDIHSFVPIQGGTFDYMAPEIVDKQSSKFTKACDVYSYGVILFELATLKPANKFRERRKALLRVAVDPTEFYSFIWKCTQMEPTQRPRFTDIIKTLGSMKAGLIEFEKNRVIMKTASLTEGASTPSNNPAPFRLADPSEQTSTVQSDPIELHYIKSFNDSELEMWHTESSRVVHKKNIRRAGSKLLKYCSCQVRRKSRIRILICLVLVMLVVAVLVLAITSMTTQPSSPSSLSNTTSPSPTPTTRQSAVGRLYSIPRLKSKEKASANETLMGYSTVLSLAMKVSASTVRGKGVVYFGLDNGDFVGASFSPSRQFVEVYSRTDNKSVPVLGIDYDDSTDSLCILWNDGTIRVQTMNAGYYIESKFSVLMALPDFVHLECNSWTINVIFSRGIYGMTRLQSSDYNMGSPFLHTSRQPGISNMTIQSTFKKYSAMILGYQNATLKLVDNSRMFASVYAYFQDQQQRNSSIIAMAGGMYQFYILYSNQILTSYEYRANNVSVLQRHNLTSDFIHSETVIVDMFTIDFSLFIVTDSVILHYSLGKTDLYFVAHYAIPVTNGKITSFGISSGYYYWATSSGLYSMPLEIRMKPQLVNESAIWMKNVYPDVIYKDDEFMFIAHNNGSFIAYNLQGDKSTTESRGLNNGSWVDFLLADNVYNNLAVVGLNNRSFYITSFDYLYSPNLPLFGGSGVLNIKPGSPIAFSGWVLYFVQNGYLNYCTLHQEIPTALFPVTEKFAMLTILHDRFLLMGQFNGKITVIPEFPTVRPSNITLNGTLMQSSSTLTVRIIRMRGPFIWVLHVDNVLDKFTVASLHDTQSPIISPVASYQVMPFSFLYYEPAILLGFIILIDMIITDAHIFILTARYVYQFSESDPKTLLYRYDFQIGVEAKQMMYSEDGYLYVSTSTDILRIPVVI